MFVMNAAKVPQAYRARILSFDPHAEPSNSARLDEDGLLVIGSERAGSASGANGGRLPPIG